MLLAGLTAGWCGWMGLFLDHPITLPVYILTVTQPVEFPLAL
jgi:hypothetical protein